MSSIGVAMRRAEFEARMLVSLGIVLIVCVLAYGVLPAAPPTLVAIGAGLGATSSVSMTVGCLAVGLLLAFATILRMWSGSALTSDRVMAFGVQTDRLVDDGPYRLVRNPIYLADLVAMTAFSLALPPIGMILPFLFVFHYGQVIRHEEAAFTVAAPTAYRAYRDRVGRLLPRRAALGEWKTALGECRLTADGIRHNALYALFVVGFGVAAFTRDVWMAFAIGSPALVDWAVVHTRKRVRRAAPEARPARGDGIFDAVLYAQCWEDPTIDRTALEIRSGDTVFCITSGGCNALAFLLDDPDRVIALDLNPSQGHLLDLKRCALERLGHGELLELMGARDSERRSALYARIRPALGEDARRYWDGRTGQLARGVLHCGRYEQYMGLLRRWIRRLVGRRAIEGLYANPDPGSRTTWFHRHWDTLWWRILTRALLSRRLLSRLFHPGMFAYVDPDFRFGAHFEKKARRALTELPLYENTFLSYILLGRFYDESHLPTWLRPENHEILRRRARRLTIVTEPCASFLSTLPAGAISKFDFSNIFEWMSPADHEAALREAVRVARDGATLVYRNLLVARERPEALAARLEPDRDLARALLAKDLSFIYSNYVVERVRKGRSPCTTT